MAKLRTYVVWLLAAACLIWCGFRVSGRPPTTPQTAEASLQWKVVGSRGNPHELVGEPFKTVEAVLEVTNAGTRALSKPRLGTRCNCQIREDLPDSLEPGRTVRVGLSITVPGAGTRSDRILILEDGSRDASAVLDLTVRARESGPRLLVVPDSFRIECLAGEAPHRRISISAVEKHSEDYVVGLDVPGELAKVVTSTRTVFPTSDEFHAVTRIYEVEFLTRGDSTEERSGEFKVRLRGGESRTFKATVVSRLPIASVPARVELTVSHDGPGRTGRARVFPRVSSITDLKLKAYNAEWFEVTTQARSGALDVEITSKQVPTQEVTEDLVFVCSRGEFRLPVTLRPPAAQGD